MIDDLEDTLNYLVRVGYDWEQLRAIPAYRVRRLFDKNIDIDSPKSSKDLEKVLNGVG